MREFIISLSLVLSVSINTKAQSISPFTLNIGGFTGSQSGFSLTISTGETISIVNFTTPTGVSLSSGFLQANPPLITDIIELNLPFNAHEIIVNPNPVKNIAYLSSYLKEGGQLQYQIMDIGSKVLYRSHAFANYGAMQNQIDFSHFATGIYYVQVNFKPVIGKIKSGIYKIIKL